MYKNKYIKLIGSPKIFSFLVIWMMVLVFVGTLVQKDIGLYAAQQEYFSSWFKWISFIPLPSGRLTMLVMFLNLSCYFFRPGIFRSNKAGITITHLGVILMLVGGGLTSFFSHEGSLVFEEGQTVDFYENYYEKEFVIVDVSNRDFDNFTVFSSKLLYEGNVLSHSSIPFEIKILDYFINCKPSSRIYQGSEEFKGMAKNFFLQEIKSEKEFEKNISGMIYQISGAGDQDGIYMNYLGQPITQRINVSDVEYMLILRRERVYLPFDLSLIDFEKVMHPGTNIAKSYSSKVNLFDDGVSRNVLISMNEPLRHRDFTFYQASFIEGEERDSSVLATVKNRGRLFPYISTIIMCMGLLYHMLFMVSKRFKKVNKI